MDYNWVVNLDLKTAAFGGFVTDTGSGAAVKKALSPFCLKQELGM